MSPDCSVTAPWTIITYRQLVTSYSLPTTVCPSTLFLHSNLPVREITWQFADILTLDLSGEYCFDFFWKSQLRLEVEDWWEVWGMVGDVGDVGGAGSGGVSDVEDGERERERAWCVWGDNCVVTVFSSPVPVSLLQPQHHTRHHHTPNFRCWNIPDGGKLSLTCSNLYKFHQTSALPTSNNVIPHLLTGGTIIPDCVSCGPQKMTMAVVIVVTLGLRPNLHV